jgi:hypothetical protein
MQMVCAMYARLLAMLGLLSVSTSMGWSESNLPGSSTLEVYLKGDIGPAETLAEMNRELGTLMQRASFRVLWRHANEPSSSGSAHLIVVELVGACAFPPRDSPVPLASNFALASSSVVDGRVLPFSWVDCSALTRFLGPAILNLADAEQARIYGRSMARLLAHEFYHVLAQTSEHTSTGISKPRFSIADLLADHLDFGIAALERFRNPSSVSNTDEGFDRER